MEEKIKKPLPLGVQVLVMFLLFVLIVGFYLLDRYVDEKQAYIDGNTSATGVVVEKTYSSIEGTRHGVIAKFWVSVERQTVNLKGEKQIEVKKHNISYEEWLQIEVGDVATYDEDLLISIEPPFEKESEE